MRLIDVQHLGREKVIGAWLVDGCLVDPGPSSSLDALLDGLGDERPERLLLTHIHFDHAGAAGTLVKRWPGLEVWVHERGAKHLADPERLVASASRIYGEDMDRLWGEIVPVPRENLKVLGDEETREGDWRIAYTPGHASHHVAYLHEPSGTVFAGDVAGVRIPPDGYVLPPTPPPDIDIATWHRSIDLIAGWDPDAVAVTHFGRWEDVGAQLDALHVALDRLEAAARERDHASFTAWIRDEIRANTTSRSTDSFLQAMPPETLYAGLERALRRVG